MNHQDTKTPSRSAKEFSWCLHVLVVTVLSRVVQMVTRLREMRGTAAA